MSLQTMRFLIVGIVSASALFSGVSESVAQEPDSVPPLAPQLTWDPNDPRIGLRPGISDAGEAVWNMRVISNTRPSGAFVGVTNSDLAFSGNYAIQGNYNGIQVWDI